MSKHPVVMKTSTESPTSHTKFFFNSKLQDVPHL